MSRAILHKLGVMSLKEVEERCREMLRDVERREAAVADAERLMFGHSQIYELGEFTPPPVNVQVPLSLNDIIAAIEAGWRGKTDEATAYFIAERLAAAVYPKYKFSEFGRLYLEDEAFLKWYEKTMDFGNWHYLDRRYLVDQMLKLIGHLPGDYVECGVYKGAMSYLLCEAAQRSGKTVHLFDSFKGLSAPGEHDGSHWVQGKFNVTTEAVEQFLSDFKCYKIYKGWIPERFPDIADVRVSFLHVDVDLFDPTYDTIAFFYERMVPGGFIICDDYGVNTCHGATKAFDDFFAHKPENVACLPTGQSLVIKQ